MSLRNGVAEIIGLKNLGSFNRFETNKSEAEYKTGDRLGIFTLIHNSQNELLVGDSDKHSDVFLSVYLTPADSDGKVLVTVSTVVHVHNWLGTIYMLPVKPIHKLIAPFMLKKLAHNS